MAQNKLPRTVGRADVKSSQKFRRTLGRYLLLVCIIKTKPRAIAPSRCPHRSFRMARRTKNPCPIGGRVRKVSPCRIVRTSHHCGKRWQEIAVCGGTLQLPGATWLVERCCASLRKCRGGRYYSACWQASLLVHAELNCTKTSTKQITKKPVWNRRKVSYGRGNWFHFDVLGANFRLLPCQRCIVLWNAQKTQHVAVFMETMTG